MERINLEEWPLTVGKPILNFPKENGWTIHVSHGRFIWIFEQENVFDISIDTSIQSPRAASSLHFQVKCIKEFFNLNKTLCHLVECAKELDVLIKIHPNLELSKNVN